MVSFMVTLFTTATNTEKCFTSTVELKEIRKHVEYIDADLYIWDQVAKKLELTPLKP